MKFRPDDFDASGTINFLLSFMEGGTLSWASKFAADRGGFSPSAALMDATAFDVNRTNLSLEIGGHFGR